MSSSLRNVRCVSVLESGADAKMAEQLNDGIVYLMIMPYLLVGIIDLLFIVSSTKIDFYYACIIN